MTEPRTANLGVAYVVTAGRIEATINLPRQSVRFILRDNLGLERGSVEMLLDEWVYIAEAMVKVSEHLKPKAESEQGELFKEGVA